MQEKTCFPEGRLPVARAGHTNLWERAPLFSAKLAPALSAAIKSPVGGGENQKRESAAPQARWIIEPADIMDGAVFLLPQVFSWTDICVRVHICEFTVCDPAGSKLQNQYYLPAEPLFHSAFSCRSALPPLEIYVA